ncbi:MAG: biotin--[acetyl-CoA-carboxylase] ligase [Sedimentisphaerales bacterium]|nr:biotin--[acetyl-CoA-carboxylase] ligase [Sedimentisphaerales bacterium]
MAAKEYNSLDADIIENELTCRRIGKKVLLFRETASTNDIAWEYSRNPNNNGLCVFAEHQTSGRGRLGNRWLEESGQSILLSLLLMQWKDGADLLTLIAAIATAQAIQQTINTTVQIKWPNDILIEHSKVAGILVESRTDKPTPHYVVGIGINCHQRRDFFDQTELAMPATSIDLHRDDPVDRNKLAHNLIEQLDFGLARSPKEKGAIVEQFKAMSSQLGRHLIIEYNQHRHSGTCIGIDPIQGLLIQQDRGGIRMFPAGQSRIIKQSHYDDSELNP